MKSILLPNDTVGRQIDDILEEQQLVLRLLDKLHNSGKKILLVLLTFFYDFPFDRAPKYRINIHITFIKFSFKNTNRLLRFYRNRN